MLRLHLYTQKVVLWKLCLLCRLCVFFRYESIKELQKKVLTLLLEGQNVFLSILTGYGKSLVICALPECLLTAEESWL